MKLVSGLYGRSAFTLELMRNEFDTINRVVPSGAA
jgi:hypothetical protein